MFLDWPLVATRARCVDQGYVSLPLSNTTAADFSVSQDDSQSSVHTKNKKKKSWLALKSAAIDAGSHAPDLNLYNAI